MMASRLQDLPQDVVTAMDELTTQLVSTPGFPEKVALAETLWTRRNRKDDKALGHVREAAWRAKPGAAKLCRWCERSEADELDHIAPRRHYPDRAFTWTNLVSSCGPCNVRKRENAALVIDGVTFDLPSSTPPTPPPPGKLALISPRTEDPLKFIEIDPSTGIFQPTLTNTSEEEARAKHTIELLGLNRRVELHAARQEAIRAVHRIIQQAQAGLAAQDNAAVEEARVSLQSMHFPSVWESLRRQRAWIPWLDAFFTAVPGALDW